VGRIRSENEDFIFLREDGRLALLADGMGGHEHGAEASRAALEIISQGLKPAALAEMMMDITCSGGDIPPEISCLFIMIDAAVGQANSTLYERNHEIGVKRFMGTTVVGLIPVQEYVLWFHVGDSRLYRLRNTILELLTRDHSAYEEWVQQGRKGQRPGSNVITRAIGPYPQVSPEVKWDAWRNEDIYLLCSDGLYSMLPEETIAGTLNADLDLSEMGRRLIAAANDAGGKDNASAILCRF
jgi:protein phosphatase